MLNFLSCRPFGVEIELNSFNGIEVTPRNKLPDGIYFVGNLISTTLEKYVEIRDWGHTHWYKDFGSWVIKPDNSCGIEVCSPVMKGWYGLKEICKVVDAFNVNSSIGANKNCSLHVHIDISDLRIQEVENVLRWWVKCEPIFFDSVPDNRKNNQFCQFIGLWEWIDLECSASHLVDLLGMNKYFSVNTFHFSSGERDTIEFRIGEHTLCKNSFFAKNWIKLLIHFVEMTKYKYADSLSWLDLKDLFDLLDFFRNDLSLGMLQLRNWFLGRLFYNVTSSYDGFLKEGREITKRQIGELLKLFSDFDLQEALYPQYYNDAVYNKIYST